MIALAWAAWAAKREDWRVLREPRVWGFGLLFPFSVILWTLAVTHGTIRAATFGLYLGSLFASAALGRFFFAERLSRSEWWAFAVALGGVVAFASPWEGLDADGFSLLLGTAGGLVQAVNLCYRRWLGEMSRPMVVTVQGLAGFAVSIAFALAVSSDFSVPSPGMLAAGILYGATVVLVSFLLLAGARNISVGSGSIILSSELVWAVGLGAAIFGEVPTAPQVVGCILLLAAVFLSKSGITLPAADRLSKP